MDDELQFISIWIELYVYSLMEMMMLWLWFNLSFFLFLWHWKFGNNIVGLTKEEILVMQVIVRFYLSIKELLQRHAQLKISQVN